jgi:hypothetical protein
MVISLLALFLKSAMSSCEILCASSRSPFSCSWDVVVAGAGGNGAGNSAITGVDLFP